MKAKFSFFTLFFLLSLCFSKNVLFASGRRNKTEEITPVGAEYVLCITSPDVSALPLSRQIAGDTVVKNFTSTLSNLSFRFRGEEEAAYYRDYAWSKARSDAAKALDAKRAERDQLIYRGDSTLRYRKNLKAINEAILQLEADLYKTEALVPVAELKPVFKLTAGNMDGNFPLPPGAGSENPFCIQQNADAFIVSSLSEYHDRVYLNIKMYTRYTGSYSFEDSVLFSSEDLSKAIDEISVRLAAAVSKTFQSTFIVRTGSPEAMVLVDGSFAGMGETDLQTHLPGEVEISIYADNYVPVSFPLELNPAELTELYIDLTPFGTSAFQVTVPDNPGSKVFLGSLYLGEAPLTMELPKTTLSYISVETPEGRIGTTVYRDSELVRGNAEFVSRDRTEAVFSTRIPRSAEEKRVERARRGFYGFYGAFWFILPAALIVSGVAGTYISANNDYITNNPDPDTIDYDKYQRNYERALTARKVQIGANITWGVALGAVVFQIVRYLVISGRDSSPIVKAPPKPVTVEPLLSETAEGIP